MQNNTTNTDAARVAGQFTITDKAADLASFEPVTGNYDLNKISSEMEDITPGEIEDAIGAELAAKHGFAVTVEILQSNGHAITGETPSAGSFIATRK